MDRRMMNSEKRPVYVFGLGYVGLPLIVEAQSAGFRCFGVDLDDELISNLRAGSSHVEDISNSQVSEILALGVEFCSEFNDPGEPFIAVIAVPTPLDQSGRPELKFVASACRAIAPHLRSGSLVVLESTTYPGTTEYFVKDLLEVCDLEIGAEVSLAFSPERIDPGNRNYRLSNTPKIVGGIDDKSASDARNFYEVFISEVLVVSDARTAEMVKLYENTFRLINIAFANEMAQLMHGLGIDSWEVIHAASSKPYGFMPFYPGPGVGGHCIPVDPNYLLHAAEQRGLNAGFINLANEVNRSMPNYVVERIGDLLLSRGIALENSTVAILGLSYKADVADTRETPASDIIRGLRALGADIRISDPNVSKFRVDGDFVPVVDLDTAISGSDITVLLQSHSSYDLEEICRQSRFVFDTRGVTNAPNSVLL